MFKKYRVVVSLVAIALFFGGVSQTVGASTNSGDAGNQGKTYRFIVEGNMERGDYSKIEQYLAKCLSEWHVNGKENGQTKVEAPEQEKQPEGEQTEKPQQEQPKNEQPKVEKPKEQPKQEQPKAEQPNEQPKQEQPKKEEQNKEGKEEKPVSQPTQPTQNNQADQGSKKEETINLGQLNQFEQQVFELTNQERTKHGLQPFAIDYELSRVAREKSRDMAVNRYFDHNSPTYGSPFDMMKSYGITYRAAGENIAKGQRTPEEVVKAWMNSPGHRANILNSSFTHIGVGYVENGNHWTQQFIGK